MPDPGVPYGDIISMPHHVSPRHPRMTLIGRSAQFAPFAALRGYSDTVAERVRATCPAPDPGEYETAELDRRLRAVLADAGGEEYTLLYFRPDGVKPGGSYFLKTGRIRGFDASDGCIVFYDREKIPVSHVCGVAGGQFDGFI